MMIAITERISVNVIHNTVVVLIATVQTSYSKAQDERAFAVVDGVEGKPGACLLIVPAWVTFLESQ